MVYNFCAGPATIAREVLSQARDEFLDWHADMSVMEVSHRSKEFEEMAFESIQDLKELLLIPNNYKVLFLHGGAAGQFSAVPLNLATGFVKACYINTGIWSQKAIVEAKKFIDVSVIASTAPEFRTVPAINEQDISESAAYVHFTSNETIGGLEFHLVPEVGDTPLISDMSSNILSGPIDVKKFGLIYASAQKNIGSAGLTLVIIREDLLERCSDKVPMIWNYAIQEKNNSMINTPPTFAWYISSLVFKWIKKKGGLLEIAKINKRKAMKLYNFIDSSDFYTNSIEKSARSLMNVPFMLSDESLNSKFLEQSDAQGLRNLKGHRSVGGMRASIYNAMPESGVDALIDFMQYFAKKA